MSDSFGNEKEDVFIELLQKHHQQMFRLILCMVNNIHDAHDILQQASVAMWLSFEKFEVGTDFLAWASTIARNKSLSFLKSRGYKGYVFSQRFVEQLAQHEAAHSELHEERLKALDTCRDKLAEKDRKLLGECYGGQASIRDVARRIGRSADSVSHSLTRIRRMLFHCIQLTLAKEGHP